MGLQVVCVEEVPVLIRLDGCWGKAFFSRSWLLLEYQNRRLRSQGPKLRDVKVESWKSGHFWESLIESA